MITTSFWTRTCAIGDTVIRGGTMSDTAVVGGTTVVVVIGGIVVGVVGVVGMIFLTWAEVIILFVVPGVIRMSDRVY